MLKRIFLEIPPIEWKPILNSSIKQTKVQATVFPVTVGQIPFLLKEGNSFYF